MDQETIRREASEAIKALELESEVSGVTQAGKNWCIQFSGDYGQYCDTFQNQFEHDNSARVIREKVKKHLLGQITLLRNKGGRKVSKKGFDEDQPNLTQLFQDAVTETVRAVGDVIDRTLGATETAIESAGEVATRLSAGTAEALRPVAEARPVLLPTRRAASRKAAPRKSAGKGVKKSAKNSAKAAAGKGKKRASGKKRAAVKKKGSRKR
jgi:hypothetical protein